MSADTAQRKSLRELRESTGTLFAKNNTNKKITCNTDQVTFELEPVGYDDSIRIVPKECLNIPGFQRLWMRNAVTISDDEAMENEITLLMGGQVAFVPKVYTVDEKTGEQIQVVAEITEAAESNDIVFKETGDPTSARGYAIVAGDNKCVFCKTPVMIAQKFLDEGEPPLCPDHSHQKGQVASTPQPDGSWIHQATTIEPVVKSNLPSGG